MTAFDADCLMTFEVLRHLPEPWLPLVEACRAGPLYVVAEGSSRLVPLGFTRRLCKEAGMIAVDGSSGRLLPARWPGRILALSNSGRTREIIEGLAGRSYLAVTGLPDSALAQSAQADLALLPRPERAVAATASVVGQAVVLAEALSAAHAFAFDRHELCTEVAAACHAARPALPSVEHLWILGADDGVAEELALKSWEVAGLPATPVNAGLALHGLEEVCGPGDAIWLMDVADDDREPIRRRLAVTDSTLLDWSIPQIGAATPLLRLVTGWHWLAAWAEQRGRDPAVPRRARKIGNEI